MNSLVIDSFFSNTYSWIFKVIVIAITITPFIETTYNYKEMEIVDDLPTKTNLEEYLTSLEKTVDFVNMNKELVDLNVCFGIYIINVNLRRTLQLKGRSLPLKKQVRLERMVKLNDEVVSYFTKRTHTHMKSLPEVDKSYVGLYKLYTNETSWPAPLPPFNMELLKKTHFYPRKKLEVIYSKWNTYLKNIYGSEDTQGLTTSDLDNCLSLLAQNPRNENFGHIHCQVRFACANHALNGSYFGYGIVHRVLFMLAARYSRGCVLTSVNDDNLLIKSLCARMYNEAEFIANHDFGIPDLIMEQITLCSLDGHGQFLRRSWIEELLDYQTAIGCYNLIRVEGNNTAIKLDENTTWSYVNHDKIIYGGTCHSRTTAVGGAMIASAVRFIIENNF